MVNKFKVLEQVIFLDMQKGHLKWRVTDLARRTKVGRELIYYRFGKTKKEIFDNAFKTLATEFYGLSNERIEKAKKEGFLNSLRQTHKMFIENPWLGQFYLKWRLYPSPIRDKYLEIEKNYQQKLKMICPNLKKAEIEALHAFLHGIVTSPFLSEQGLKVASDWTDQILDLSRVDSIQK